jgi:RNA polymerase sigma factor for flagellar operon FliA
MLGYKQTITVEEKEQIIQDMLPYIKYTAYRLAWRLPPQLTIDDLISVGIMGLLDAIERFDPSRSTTLKTFAEYRIKGAMLDELRSAEWAPKHLQKKINELKNAFSHLEKTLGRPPSEEEVAECLGIALEELFRLMNDASGAVTLSLDEIESRVDSGNGDYNIHEHIMDEDTDSPLVSAEKADMKRILAEAIEELPERERVILSLYYWDELTFKEIGKVLNLSESRVSQLHAKALLLIKAKLEKENKY